MSPVFFTPIHVPFNARFNEHGNVLCLHLPIHVPCNARVNEHGDVLFFFFAITDSGPVQRPIQRVWKGPFCLHLPIHVPCNARFNEHRCFNNKSGNVRWERLATGVVPLPSGCTSTDAELAGATAIVDTVCRAARLFGTVGKPKLG